MHKNIGDILRNQMKGYKTGPFVYEQSLAIASMLLVSRATILSFDEISTIRKLFSSVYSCTAIIMM